ncbi:hypothetical protein RI129_003966 [Pyrocoelia pectoralis]|uniref:Uncharacterized protein n=1 Tax=Pyrocoelia pectoralis TaxID=417401 RepID=A0AAN7VQK9_9COLE
MNWKGYIKIATKFSQILNEHSFSIKDPTLSLVNEVLKNLQLLNKDYNMQNDNSLLRLCNFYLKISLRLCELFDSNAEDHWPLIYKLLHTCYIYYPPFLRLKDYDKEIISNVNSFLFSQVDFLLGKLCLQPCFYQIIEKVQPVAPNTLVFYALTFKVMSLLVVSHPEIVRFAKISAIMSVFFTMLERGYCEFWDIILVTSDKNGCLYDDTVLHLANIICTLNEEEYNQVEDVLFQNIFVQCPWCSLLAVDIWHAVLRKENQQLNYDTICNIIEQSEFFLIDDQINQPQLVFLKNLLQRLFENLSPNYRSMLLGKYPLYNKLHIWKVFGFMCFPKNEFVSIAAQIIDVVHKTNGFISANCNLEDFKSLCNGLDTVSFVPDHSEIDTSHLVLSLFSLWKLILDLTPIDSYLFNYILQKLIPATNNFLSHFNTTKLLYILNGLSQLLNSNLSIKIVTTSLLCTLTRGLPNISLEQKQLFTPISEIFYKLITHKNPIINQNALIVFLQLSDNSQRNIIIIQGAIKGNEVEKRISNFRNNKVDMGPLNTTEYFQMQAKYKYVHVCYVSANDSRSACSEVNSTELNNVVKRIKLDVELFHKLTNRTSEAEENLVKIMRILNH